MGQQQVQQSGQPPRQTQQRRQVPWKRIVIATIIVAFLLAFACVILWNLINMGVLHGAFFDTLSKILVAIGSAATAIGGVLTAYVGIAFSLKSFFTPSNEKTESPPKLVDTATAPPTSAPSSPPIIIQLQPQAPPTIPQPSPIPDKPISAGIIGTFPPTDPKTIQQRHKVVEQVYSELTRTDINCIVLTGIGGIGKSTIAALVYRHAEEQRKQNTTPFAAESLWFTAEATTTFADLAGWLSTALDKPLANFGQLPPQQQATALIYALNTTNNPQLVVVNQFENLLNAQTGQASDPGLGEWIDVLNSQLCRCRVLLTSRPMPRGSHDYPPTHMQEYPVEGLETNEGVELLRNQGVQTTQATDEELRTAVGRCAGHALSLELLASILRRNRSLSLHSLFNNPTYAQLWMGNIAPKLLDYIYEQQLNDLQRKLLAAFSVYREPVPLEAAQAQVDVDATTKTSGSLLDALNVLLAQHLLQDSGNEWYQLHIIVANYAKEHFDIGSEQANRQALNAAHAKAAQYYLQYAETNCSPRDKRRNANDVKPLTEAVWQYCQTGRWQEAYDLMLNEGLFSDLRRWGRNADLLELCQLLLPSREWQPERSQAARIYAELGEVYNDLGKKQEALASFEQALVIRREVGDRHGQGETLNDLGTVYVDLGKKQEALTSFEQALAILREVGDRGWEGETLNNLGEVYNALDKQQEALAYYQQALGIRREVGDQRGEGETLHNLGEVHDDLGKQQEALAYYQQALTIRREIGDRGGEGTTLHNTGALYFERSRYDVALAFFLLARGIFEEVLSPHRDDEQCWIDDLRGKVGEEEFAALLARVEPQAQQVVERALREGL